jgi:hypothetical protein
MPEGNLPEKAKKVYLEAEASAKKTCPEGEGHEECVARKSWAAVKRGWKKEGDKWIPKSTAEFSLYISKASFDKATQERRWYAVASDTDPDSYDDEMSLSLYEDFIDRIERKELPPERHRSDFWSGGMPYLSISHYLDLNGSAVPGPTDSVYIDGKCLKAKGKFDDTPLGRACFDAVCKDLYGEEKSEHDNKVRISIAFVDWGHRHKSNGYEFFRENLDDICPECLKEIILGKSEGKVFLKGHLIHLALTRVPVNERTSMEVRSMTTQKEDAESIVGEELAEEIEQLSKDVGKADLVIKSEQEEPVQEEPVQELAKMDEDEEDDEEMKDKEKKKEEKKSHALSESWESFLSIYDEVVLSEIAYKDKVHNIQAAFEQLGDAIKSSFAPTPKEREEEALTQVMSMLSQINDRLEAQEQRFAILEQKSLASTPKETVPTQPVRRSMQYNPAQAPAPVKPGSVADIVNKSLGIFQ